MLKRPLFIVKYWICWILLFEAARVGFLLANFREVQLAGAGLSFRSLFYGLRMDLSMATYIVLPVILFVILSHFIKFFRSGLLYLGYTSLVLLFILPALFADVGLFKAWGTRLDATPLKYLSSPKEAWASVSHLPLFWILLSLAVLYLVLIFLSKKLLDRNTIALHAGPKKGLSFLVILLLTGLFVIPLRGGLQLAPLNQSSVYFSQNNFANMASINAPWNFLYALNHNTGDQTNPFQVAANPAARRIVDSLFSVEGRMDRIIDLQKTPAPNVIVITWESFTKKAMGLEKEGVMITPGFEELKKEGVYFSNIYASGDRTDKGIVAILSGYPSQPTTSIVKIPAKAAKLPMLSKVFRDSGYHTSFHYGGELEFANMKAYLTQGSFDQFVSVDDFNKKDQNSKWGAHDGVVMARLLGDLAKSKQPFFSVWLTLSSHEPYEIPSTPVLTGHDDVSKFLSSLHYTDSVLYKFIGECKKQSWWSNTVVVIVADHGHRLMPTGKKTDDFKIPMLLLGGALSKTGVEIARLGSQNDLAAILLGQLRYPAKAFTWSKNLMDSSVKQWSYFSFNNGFGYVEPGKGFVFDNVGKLLIEKEGVVSGEDITRGKLIQQLTFQDYLDK
jgi:phosphoglycerol transferase MdoB-like AlkP superfamily enzyme